MNNFPSNQNIMIHVVPDRLWYVEEYLIPSLKTQNINNITIWNDINKSGNLAACLSSYKDLPNDGYTWHLQDDIIISDSFAEVINNDTNEITCGFSTNYDKYGSGYVKPEEMWFSFPCIKIPNKLAKEFVEWCNIDTISSERIKNYIRANKYDDTLFKIFVAEKYPDMKVLNLEPNIVNHIDWLLGGSITNPKRYKIAKKVMSRYWREEDKYLVDKIENELISRQNINP